MTDHPVNPVFLVLDLELNQPSNKIIEIGIVIADIYRKEIMHKESIYVKIDEPLNPYIIDLTGITEEILESQGVDLLTAAKRIRAIQDEFKPFINPVTWGQGDKKALEEQVRAQLNDYEENKEFNDALKIQMGRREVDVKTLYVAYRLANKQRPQGGLAKALRHMNQNFKGKKHSARDDAENTYYMFLEMLKFFDKSTLI
jgi:inhibitor of KinA sporulation pathway (predicted exonuclease)